MSFYEELLTLGQWLQPAEKLALYRFLLESQQNRYLEESGLLLKNGKLETSISNGKISYLMNESTVSYAATKKGTEERYDNFRSVNLSTFPFLRSKQLSKFFAQSEVEVIANFPLPGVNPQEQSGYGFFAYPFYDLNYYSDGRGRISGFFKKIQAKDDELLEKLLAS